MTASLSLHSGAAEATRADVLASRTPEGTATWQPVPHQVLMEGLLVRLDRMGLHVEREQHGLGKEGQRWFGVFDLKTKSLDRGYSLALGLRNSHDQSFAAAVLMGSRVWICDNLSLSGEVQIVRKHTSQILADLPVLMDEAMVQLGTLEAFMHVRIQHYQRTIFDDKAANDFLVRAVMARALPVVRLPQVYALWKRPLHEAFEERTAWSLFNAFTEVYKSTAFSQLPTRTQRLHLLLDRYVGAPKFEDIEPVTTTDLIVPASEN